MRMFVFGVLSAALIGTSALADEQSVVLIMLSAALNQASGAPSTPTILGKFDKIEACTSAAENHSVVNAPGSEYFKWIYLCQCTSAQCVTR